MFDRESSSAGAEVSPQLRFDTAGPPNYCSLGPTPLLVTGFLRQLLMQHFADRDSIEDPALRGDEFLWRASNPQGIVIESIALWDPDQTAQRPAVLIKRNDWRPLKLGINNTLMGIPSVDGFDRRARFWTGSHTLFCKTVEGAQAELLGWEVANELDGFASEMRSYLDLKRFEVAEVGALVQLEEALGGFAVPVTVAYASERQWIVRRHAPRLKTLLLSLMTP